MAELHGGGMAVWSKGEYIKFLVGDSPDWSSNQAKSPLGNVNVEEDVIIVVGHGGF